MDTDKIINEWWRDKIQNSPVSRHTEVHNHLHAAIEDLKSRLKPEPEEEVEDDVV